MANIDIQEKRGQPMWVWIAAIVGLLVLAAVIWALMSNGDDRDDARMMRDTLPAARDTVRSPRDTLIGSLDRADDTMPAFIILARQPAGTGSDGDGV
jgi:hypothetical protein